MFLVRVKYQRNPTSGFGETTYRWSVIDTWLILNLSKSTKSYSSAWNKIVDSEVKYGKYV